MSCACGRREANEHIVSRPWSLAGGLTAKREVLEVAALLAGERRAVRATIDIDRFVPLMQKGHAAPSPRYAPPPGPPPDEPAPPHYAPPAGPPPEEVLQEIYGDTPPAYSATYYESPALNASGEAFDRGVAFCHAHPLDQPRALSPEEHATVVARNMSLCAPAGFPGSILRGRDGTTLVRVPAGCDDTTLLSVLPLSPAGSYKRVYYELQIVSRGEDGSAAAGYCALPYPPFRLPGWHRASVAVHADDGHRFASDPMGGLPTVPPLNNGDVLGLGIDPAQRTVFVSHNGALVTQFDAVSGLEGSRDVYSAVGVCGDVVVIVNLGGARGGRQWLWSQAEELFA